MASLLGSSVRIPRDPVVASPDYFGIVYSAMVPVGLSTWIFTALPTTEE